MWRHDRDSAQKKLEIFGRLEIRNRICRSLAHRLRLPCGPNFPGDRNVQPDARIASAFQQAWSPRLTTPRRPGLQGSCRCPIRTDTRPAERDGVPRARRILTPRQIVDRRRSPPAQAAASSSSDPKADPHAQQPRHETGRRLIRHGSSDDSGEMPAGRVKNGLAIVPDRHTHAPGVVRQATIRNFAQKKAPKGNKLCAWGVNKVSWLR